MKILYSRTEGRIWICNYQAQCCSAIGKLKYGASDLVLALAQFSNSRPL